MVDIHPKSIIRVHFPRSVNNIKVQKSPPASFFFLKKMFPPTKSRKRRPFPSLPFQSLPHIIITSVEAGSPTITNSLVILLDTKLIIKNKESGGKGKGKEDLDEREKSERE